MRTLHRLSIAWIDVAFTAASLQVAAIAQETTQGGVPDTMLASPANDATWMKRYTQVDERRPALQPASTSDVALAPSSTPGNGTVTLWDEITPPAPLPAPVNTQQALQSRVTSPPNK
ncbi:hypothetical protein EGY31_32325 [Burkholderia multivorans]|uniref:hypothetical protein n=1 Tax=Burkholderia ubonensis TaxID=101571 RepID=UPI000F6CBEFF|nr:hypothetical protein [Burkholderia ubonensis]AYZ67715.1 hypothetical protein EGY31_32325 [Burkholderia multivorans]VWC30743.1 hypothetical protein BUB20358_06348 [Burkholderia ubonensis]